MTGLKPCVQVLPVCGAVHLSSSLGFGVDGTQRSVQLCRLLLNVKLAVASPTVWLGVNVCGLVAGAKGPNEKPSFVVRNLLPAALHPRFSGMYVPFMLALNAQLSPPPCG